MSIDYNEKIPNNVDLAANKTLQRALEHWQPGFLNWWGDMGPEGTSNADVILAELKFGGILDCDDALPFRDER